MRVLTRGCHAIGRAFGAASSLFHGFAASTLSLAEMKDGIRAYWQVYNDNREQDVFAGLLPWESDLVERFVTPGSTVLLVGCGSGRQILPLLARSCRVTGVDPASQPLGLCRRVLAQRGLSAELIEGFVEDVALPGSFDTVIFGAHCYSYMPGSERRVRTLRSLAAKLNPGGRIILSYQSMPRPRPLAIALARMAGTLSGSDWRMEPGDHVGWKRLDGVPHYSFAHAFFPEEMAAEVAAAGLSIAYQRDPPDDPAYCVQISTC